MQITVVTYNILKGGDDRLPLLLTVLQAIQPDVVVLQEVRAADAVATLAAGLQLQSYIANGTSSSRLALLSRYPLVSAISYHPFPPIRTTILDAVIAPASQHRLRIMGVHLVPHLAWPLELWRVWELQVALQRVGRGVDGPCLIAGDFNAIAPGDRVLHDEFPRFLKWMLYVQGGRIFRWAVARMHRAGFIDCYRRLHPAGDGFTLPPPRPNARLDYMFANQALINAVVECTVVREPVEVEQASDHYPVKAVIEL